jgi:hypothetical protein
VVGQIGRHAANQLEAVVVHYQLHLPNNFATPCLCIQHCFGLASCLTSVTSFTANALAAFSQAIIPETITKSSVSLADSEQ